MIRKILLLFFVVLVAAAVAVMSFQKYIKSKIEESLSEGCPACEVKIGTLKINPLTGETLAHFVSFSSDPKNTTTVKVKAYHVKIALNLSKLLERKIQITNVAIKDFKVTVEEKYIPNEPPAKEEELKEVESSYSGKIFESLPDIKIEGINLENGTLDYTLKKYGKDARLTVSEIRADISALCTRGNRCPRYVAANVTAKFQESGAVIFRLYADLFSIKNKDLLEIDVQHLKMSELNTFFVNEDGIEMSGDLNQIHTKVTLSQGHVSGVLWANYKDLSLKINPTAETAAFEAALANIIQKSKIVQTKPVIDKPPARAPVSYDRLPGQGVVKYILMGLKEAAIKSASN